MVPEKMQHFDITIIPQFSREPAYTCTPVRLEEIKGTNQLCCGSRLIMGGDRSY